MPRMGAALAVLDKTVPARGPNGAPRVQHRLEQRRILSTTAILEANRPHELGTEYERGAGDKVRGTVLEAR